MELNVLSLCCGIGTGLYVLKKIYPDAKINYYGVEIDEKKRKVAKLNHPEIMHPFTDVVALAANLDKLKFEAKVDLVLCGFTCTSLSSQGNRKDFDGESRIFYDCVKILNWIKENNNLNVKFLFENVASMRLTARDEISKQLGVDHWLGDSSLTSGQARKRYYWFNWPAPIIIPTKVVANDCLDDDGILLVAVSKSNRNRAGAEEKIVEGRQRTDGKAGTLTTGHGCFGQSCGNFVFTKKMKMRPLTVSECKRLQSIPDYNFGNIPDSEIFTMIGEGWESSMIQYILSVLDSKVSVEGLR